MDLQKVCRICLRIPKQSTDLFEDRLLKKIKAISSIQIKNINEFSNKICEKCLKLVHVSYRFRVLIRNSYKHLNNRLKEAEVLAKRKTIEIESASEKNETSNSGINEAPDDDELIQNQQMHKYHEWFYKNVENILCHICGIQIQARNLKSHINFQHENTPIVCDECGKLCMHAGALRIHKETHAPKKFSCPFCEKSFPLMCRLTVHLKTHNKSSNVTEVIKIVPVSESIETSDISTIDITLVTESAAVDEPNSKLNEVIKKKQTTKYDGNYNTVERVACNICGVKIQCRNLKRHINLQHIRTPVHCDECGKLCKHVGALRIHKESHQPKKFSCHLCEKTFPLMCRLTAHLKLHNKSSYVMRRIKFTAPELPNIKASNTKRTETSNSKSDQSIDKRKIQKCPNFENNVCHICGIQVQACNLKAHIKFRHAKSAPVPCDECGKLCTHARALRVHKQSHQPKNFSCHVCGKTFPLMCRLTTHLKVHDKEYHRPKRDCLICGKSVISITKHMRSHTGEKPWVCTYCKKGLSDKTALQRHMRLHTNERPHVCTHCGSSYRQRVSLRTHVMNKHNDIDIDMKQS